MPSLSARDVNGPAAEIAARLEALVRGEFAYVWRICRRLGLTESDADDATQQVFLTASRRLPDVRAGSEKAFLYGVAINISAKWRRARVRRREDDPEVLSRMDADLPSAEELLERRGEIELLDALLDAMPDDLRTTFVLHEIEQQTTAQIAAVLQIPVGTASSRLRRAREDFSARLTRWRARHLFQGDR